MEAAGRKDSQKLAIWVKTESISLPEAYGILKFRRSALNIS